MWFNELNVFVCNYSSFVISKKIWNLNLQENFSENKALTFEDSNVEDSYMLSYFL